MHKGKFVVGQRKTMNLKMHFEWVPCKDYFLERRVTDEQSVSVPSQLPVPLGHTQKYVCFQ